MEVLITVALVGTVIAILILVSRLSSRDSAMSNLRAEIEAAQRQHEATIADLRRRNEELLSSANDQIRVQVEAWRLREIEDIRQQERSSALTWMSGEVKKWTTENEGRIRADAIARSQANIVGKAAEHIAPYLRGFEWNPKDARFIGSPVDFVVFDGLDAGRVERIVFVEVKTGSSELIPRQKQIRDVVTSGQIRVAWGEIRVSLDARHQNQQSPPHATGSKVDSHAHTQGSTSSGGSDPRQQELSAASTTRPSERVRSPLASTKTVNLICKACGHAYSLTLRRGEDSGNCPKCGRREMYLVSWT